MRPPSAQARRGGQSWNYSLDFNEKCGSVQYVLVVRDFIARVSVTFTPDQLEHSRDVRNRLYRLWGDLLQIRNNLVHGQALAISGQITGQVTGTTENE